MKHVARTTALAMLLGLLGAGLVSPVSAATATGTVKGVMTLDGTPLAGLKVELHPTGDDGFDDQILGVTTTDSHGAYTFKKVDVGGPEYVGNTIIIRDPSYRIVATSRTFTGHAGKTVTRNASLTTAASITGSLKRANGIPTDRLHVDVFGPYALLDRYHETASTDVYATQVDVATDGTYAVKGLPAGDYWLGYVDESQRNFAQCYDNVLAGGKGCDGTEGGDTDGTKIHLTEGQDVTLGDQVLATTGRRISGIVTDTSGKPIRYADVTAVDGSSHVGPHDLTASTGEFRIGPVANGNYRLSVSALSPWAPQTGTAVFDATSGDVTGVEIKLKSKALIAATLTPGTGTVKVAVDVTRSSSGSKPSGTVIIRWGTVSKTVSLVSGKATATLTGLPAGNRRITVEYSGTSSTAATTAVFHAVVK